MLIIHIIPGDLWAGAESQVYNTIYQLIRNTDHKFSVILFNNGELYKRLSKEKVTLHVISETQNSDVAICRKIKDILYKTQPDVIHTHEYKSHILSVIAKLMSASECRIVRTFHGQTVTPFEIKPIAISFFEKIVLRFSTACIIAVSKNIKNVLRKRYPNTRVSLIYNAVMPFIVKDMISSEVRTHYGIGADVLWIGTASRLVNVKNLGMLIDAAKILSERSNKEFRVSIFGEGILEGELKQKIKSYQLEDRVTLHGHCSNIISVFKALDIFVLTSFNEGLPMSLLESMSVGTVPVCTSVGGIPEVINHESNGYLVDSNNASQMADVLSFLYDNREVLKSTGRAAQDSVLRRFSLDKATNALSKIYESL